MKIDHPRNNGKARIRGIYKGRRFSINCDNDKEKVVSAQIKLDIEKGIFNPSKYHNHDKGPQGCINLPELYIKWVNEVRNGNLQTNSNYSQVLLLLKDNSLPELDKEGKWSHTTYNRRLITLNQFSEWLLSWGYISENPYRNITKRKRREGIPKTNRLPLSSEEINLFLKELKTHKYGSYYYPFIYVLFRTGMRNEEIIGLRVGKINFVSSTIKIDEVLAKGKTSNAKQRIRKATKNGKIRFIPMEDDIKGIMSAQCQGKGCDELVFTSPKGMAIDDRMLQRRIFKPIMREVGLGERDMYCARHSFGTRAIEQGEPLTTVSELMGNKVDTLVRHYVKPIGQPKSLPKL